MKVAGSGFRRFCITRVMTMAPAVSARLASSSSDSSLSVEISMTFSLCSTMPPLAMASLTRSSACSISFIQFIWGMRLAFTGPLSTMEKLSYSISPKNAALTPVHAPSRTPTAHMESKRISRSACRSTLDSSAFPPGWVWMQRKPLRRSRLRRRCSSGSAIEPMEPMAISSTLPSRPRYTSISRLISSVKRTST